MSQYLPVTIAIVLTATWIAGLSLLPPADAAASPEPPGPSIEQSLAQGLEGAAVRARPRFQPWPPPSKDGSWRLVASTTTSNAWLYSARTGRVYRVLAKCPQGYPDGCLIPLPVVYGPHRSDELPSHGDDD